MTTFVVVQYIAENKKNLKFLRPNAFPVHLMYVKRKKVVFSFECVHTETIEMTIKKTEKLVKLAKKHDKDAFTELMQSHMQDMYKVGLAILMNDEDVADAIGDTILTCYEKLKTLKEDKFFKTWMTRILINNCYEILDKRKRRADLDEWEETSVTDDYNIELKEALASIDEKYRIVITLYYVEEMSTAEIAKFLEIPKSTVTTRLQRGREALAKYYKE